MRVLSGIQPSGSLHIGNYFGMMRRMIAYQEEHELYCFIVNLHAMTTVSNAKELREGTIAAATDFLALGLDPEKAIFWVQSDVPEVTELTWILSNVTPMGLLQRCHSYKDKIARGLSPNHGLFAYPVLMAADILLYQSEIIPVGKDQKQHVEVARDIAIKFNQTYGETFVIPEPEIEDEVAVVPGIDGQKMSKSYDNTIEIFADEESVRQKVMGIVTDSRPIDEKKDPEADNLFLLYKLFAAPEDAASLADRYRTGGVRYSEVKKELFSLIIDYFGPYRRKRAQLAKDPSVVREILRRGAERARERAAPTIEKVRERVGIKY
ncbi:tryptophanyl-tRNA synthetase [candidate division TA06 bacterium DG_24]|uniref:Tryptophan--tRNA ligase n=1 Tax=candidate division TA06 bacterium DG_24 TaxID=1703770 RepID=A0A0S7WNF4_UNCT6|nr:MAG: tryptophanyl-tRNA synthetase [candidate division TA06 bacterium DG_24]